MGLHVIRQLWIVCCEKTPGKGGGREASEEAPVAGPVCEDGGLDQSDGVHVGRSDPLLWKDVWGLLIGWLWVGEKKRSQRWLRGFGPEQWDRWSCHQLGWGP